MFKFHVYTIKFEYSDFVKLMTTKLIFSALLCFKNQRFLDFETSRFKKTYIDLLNV